MSHTILSSKQNYSHSNVVVLFNASMLGATLLFNADEDLYRDDPLALINPDLAHLSDFTTDKWKLVDGTIVGVTTTEEREQAVETIIKEAILPPTVIETKETIVIEKKDEQVRQDVQVHGGMLTTINGRIEALEVAAKDLSEHSRIDQLSAELHNKNRDLSRALQLQSKELQILTRRADLLLSETSDLKVENREQLRRIESSKEKVEKLEQKCNVYNKIMLVLAALSLIEFIVISFK